MILTMECDGRRFEVLEELTWLLARCTDPDIEVRAPDLVTLRRRVGEAVMCLGRVPGRHALYAGDTR